MFVQIVLKVLIIILIILTLHYFNTVYELPLVCNWPFGLELWHSSRQENRFFHMTVPCFLRALPTCLTFIWERASTNQSIAWHTTYWDFLTSYLCPCQTFTIILLFSVHSTLLLACCTRKGGGVCNWSSHASVATAISVTEPCLYFHVSQTVMEIFPVSLFLVELTNLNAVFVVSIDKAVSLKAIWSAEWKTSTLLWSAFDVNLHSPSNSLTP